MSHMIIDDWWATWARLSTGPIGRPDPRPHASEGGQEARETRGPMGAEWSDGLESTLAFEVTPRPKQKKYDKQHLLKNQYKLIK